MTVLGLTCGFSLIRGLWPVWGLLTPLIWGSSLRRTLSRRSRPTVLRAVCAILAALLDNRYNQLGASSAATESRSAISTVVDRSASAASTSATLAAVHRVPACVEINH